MTLLAPQAKKLMFIELTVPWEGRREKFERKSVKYRTPRLQEEGREDVVSICQKTEVEDSPPEHYRIMLTEMGLSGHLKDKVRTKDKHKYQ